MSEFARMVDAFDRLIYHLDKLDKENPNDADLGGEVRKMIRECVKEINKY